MRRYARPPSRHAAASETEDLRPSRTRLKAQMQALQALGEELTTLPPARLAEIALPEALREAIEEYHRTRSHEGRRRQLQYIGKQMRTVDDAPLREALAAIRLGPARATLQLHEAERWRDELVADDQAIERWALAYPASDLAQLRRLVRAARTDAAAAAGQRSGRGYRALYQFVKPWMEHEHE
jgi:ribosome-associated protein